MNNDLIGFSSSANYIKLSKSENSTVRGFCIMVFEIFINNQYYLGNSEIIEVMEVVNFSA